MKAQRGIMLGPQRALITVGRAIADLGVEGPAAAITTGWQERESEDDELQDAVGLPLVDLRLHARMDAVFDTDPELFRAHRAKQDQLRALQGLYRLRLRHALRALRQLQMADAPAALRDPEIEHAVEALRALDAHHQTRVDALQEAFASELQPTSRKPLSRHRAEVCDRLVAAGVVVIAGGHVAALLNRLRLFDLRPVLATRPIVAWSAGAMALTERIVLFHDRPPQGGSSAEVLDRGLGLWPRVVALPHASARLDLDDSARVALLARRFEPAQCIALDPGARLDFDGHTWRGRDSTRQLTASGGLEVMTA